MLTDSYPLTSERICSFLTPGAQSFFTVKCFHEVTSTNVLLKDEARNGAAAGLVYVAESQTMGHGRVGRYFSSPVGTGVYMSVLVKPEISAEHALRLTTATGVCVCRAIEALNPGSKPQLKWVNDVILRGKKVCGILAESAISQSGGALDFSVIGIGTNLLLPEGGFPSELAETAGAIFDVPSSSADRARYAAALLNELYSALRDPVSAELLSEYRRRSYLDGKRILISHPGQDTAPVPALALFVDEDAALRVRYNDGREESICSGEAVPTSVKEDRNFKRM